MGLNFCFLILCLISIFFWVWGCGFSSSWILITFQFITNILNDLRKLFYLFVAFFPSTREKACALVSFKKKVYRDLWRNKWVSFSMNFIIYNGFLETGRGVQTPFYVATHTETHLAMHTHTHTRMHKHAHTCMHMHAHIHTYAHACTELSGRCAEARWVWGGRSPPPEFVCPQRSLIPLSQEVMQSYSFL